MECLEEIAEQMLTDHGIRDVRVVSTPGMLTDHYNPKTKTVNLSEGVYSHNASAVSCCTRMWPCGTAQYYYEWLQMRSLVPVVSVASNFSMWMILVGLLWSKYRFWKYTGPCWSSTIWDGTLFSFITLPVEYDASNRAIAWLKRKNMVSQQELTGAEDALKWAASM